MSLPDFLGVYRLTPHTVTGRSPYSQLFGVREMRGKIPQFSLSSEGTLRWHRKVDALAKQKVKMYAAKRANAKPLPIREGDPVLLRQEKKTKLSKPAQYTQYTVCQKKGRTVTAERTTDGRMVTRNTKDFKSCPPSTKETTFELHWWLRPMMQLLLRSYRQQNVDVAEQTSEMPQPTSALPSSHPPSAEEPRYPRTERHKPARFKDYVCR